VVRLLAGRLQGRASVKEERAENLAISTSTLDETWGGISEQNLGTGQINLLTLNHEGLHCGNIKSMWSKRMKRSTVDTTGLCIAINIVVETCVDGPEMPARRLLCMCLVARAYTLVMSTKRAYRAILRELYKAVCILPHPISCSYLYVFLVN
jgi:hypothetical protein